MFKSSRLICIFTLLGLKSFTIYSSNSVPNGKGEPESHRLGLGLRLAETLKSIPYFFWIRFPNHSAAATNPQFVENGRAEFCVQGPDVPDSLPNELTDFIYGFGLVGGGRLPQGSELHLGHA